jgi:hypothetical protein
MTAMQKQQEESNRSAATQNNRSNKQNGIVTVNDEQNPTPEERDAKIPKEPDTERLRSERQSVKDGKHSK